MRVVSGLNFDLYTHHARARFINKLHKFITQTCAYDSTQPWLQDQMGDGTLWLWRQPH